MVFHDLGFLVESMDFLYAGFMKSIEVEIRAEIKPHDVGRVEKKLKTLGFKIASTTNRTSVMSFGMTDAQGRGWNKHKKKDVDIRCRVTNGKAEVVVKTGETHLSNRLELSSDVSMEQFYQFAAMVASTGLFTKVGSKMTKNYKKGSVVVSIVQSPSGITYVEIERMSTRVLEKKTLNQLQELANALELHVIESRKAFLELCERLTRIDDWEFNGTPQDLKRLKKEIEKVGSMN